jgi:CrcB protein
MSILKPILYIGAGGFLGSIARYGIQTVFSTKWPVIFPWGTFSVNIAGCLIIGLLVGLETRHQLVDDPLKWLLITGFCGGFTTFSTYSLEGLGLLNQHQYGLFLGYTLGSVILGILATLLGFSLIRWLV